MSKAEKFIEDYTKSCSNELIAVESRAGKEVVSYHDWLTPDQALRAVEIERKELVEKAIGWIKEITNHHHIVRYSDSCEPPLSELTEWFKNYMADCSMKTIKCDCPLCLQNDIGHYWCRRFADFCDQENVDLCKQLGKDGL